MRVTIIDALMGTGKTSYAIQLMNEADSSTKFIFVTPFLDEIDRVIKAVPNRKFKEPDVKHGEGRKLKSLKRLLKDGADICTSHSLFAMANEEVKELLQYENYLLIMDEVMSPISQVKLKKNDIEVMLTSKLIHVEDTGQVKWIKEDNYETQYARIKFYALASNLFRSNETTFFWNFPASIFDMFEHTYILTYMFEGQLQCYYYKYHGIQYEKKSVVQQNGNYKLVDYFQEDRSKFKELIKVFEGKLNAIGDDKHALSMGWFERNSKKGKSYKVDKLKNNLKNFITNIQKAKSDEVLWTTFVDYSEALKGNGFSKGTGKKKKPDKGGKHCFVPFSKRATNMYKHKFVLAFCVNRFVNPSDVEFFA